MHAPGSYEVSAPPERVLREIASAVAPSGAVGFSIGGEDTRARFVGSVSGNRFALRRPRAFLDPPRVVVLRGIVEATATGSAIHARYGYHPAVQLVRAIYLLFFLVTAVLVVPAATRQPELLWLVAVMGLVVLLFAVPFAYQARFDRAELRSALEDCLHVAPT
jgi:hypothetical protein